MLEETQLIGMIVTHLYISNDQSVLLFQTHEGNIYWHAEGDCCSDSWFADVIGLTHLLGKTVTNLEILDLDDPEDGRSRQVSDQVYGISIFTTEGICDIAFRNSSNGYYEGSVYENTKPPDGTLFHGHVPLVSEENERKDNPLSWHELTSDYSA